MRLAELRKKQGLTQSELAKKMNIAQNTLSQYERETRDPDTEILLKFAEFFGVSVDYILGRTEKEKPIENINEQKKSPRRKFLEEQLKDVKFAFAGDDGDYSDDDLESIYEFALFVKEKNKKREQEKKQQENKQ